MTTGELYRPGRDAALQQNSRGRVLRLTTLAGALLATPVVDASPACVDRGARSPEARCESLIVGGRERTYRIYVPARLSAPAPLRVVLHGGGGGGGGMETLTAQGFNRRADEAGALVVYPDGIGHGWNDGRGDLKARARRGARGASSRRPRARVRHGHLERRHDDAAPRLRGR